MIKGVSEDIEALRFNTAISKLMVLVNALTKLERSPEPVVRDLIVMLHPFAPDIAEEIWSRLGASQSVQHEKWPSFDLEKCKDDRITIVVQINGKKRDDFECEATASKAEMLKLAKGQERVQRFLAESTIVKEIVVPKRLVNLVVRPKP